MQLRDGTSLQPRLKIGVSSTKNHSRWKEIIVLLSGAISKADEFLHLGLDIESPNPNKVFPVESGHHFVATWSNIRAKVLSSLQGYKWSSIDVLLYGETAETAEPAIFVTIDEQQNDGWSELRRSIHGVVGDQIKVEIREGKAKFL